MEAVDYLLQTCFQTPSRQREIVGNEISTDRPIMPLQAVPMYLTYSGLDSIATVPFNPAARKMACSPGCLLRR